MHIIRDGEVYDEETSKLVKTTVENGITYDENDQVVTLRKLNFKTFAEFADEEPKNWLIEGIIALGEDSTWYGKDGEGKSTLIDDIAIHVASGRDWRGHKFIHDETVDPADVNIKERRGVIIFATERAALHRRRLEAYKKRDNLPDNTPITVVDEVINLCDPACIEIVSDTIFEFERQNKCAVGLVVIDSWAKALGGCDENLAATQNYACMSLGKIRDRYFESRFHILTVGHSGKDGSKGERGNSAKRAHMDLAVYIDNGVAEIVKANDVALGEITRFQPEEFTVTRPAVTIGNHIIPERSFTVTILAPLQEVSPRASGAHAAVFEPTGKNAAALEALKRVVASRGHDGMVPLAHWKEELTKSDLIKSGDTNNRATFKRIQKALCQHVISEGDLVGLKSQPGKLPPCPM